MNAWSHLPNADLIDWVIESLKCNPELWAAALNAVCDAILNAAWDAALDATQDAIWEAALVENTGTYWGSAWDSSTDAILALIAYDDCRQYLDMSYEQLLTYAVLSERPQAVLLLPLKWIQEHECMGTLA